MARKSRPGRHKKKPQVEFLPAWVYETEGCIRSVAEDAYYARALACDLDADTLASCASTFRAGQKSLARMEDVQLHIEERCEEGDRAARKFWEAKVCARGRVKRKS